MHLTVTLKNYRCFADHSPATFSIRDGVTAFIGQNNAGKSSLLRFFFEYQRLFQMLSAPNEIQQMIRGFNSFSPQRTITDIAELFYAENERPITIILKLLEGAEHQPISPPITITVEQLRDSGSVTATIERGGVSHGRQVGSNSTIVDASVQFVGDDASRMDIKPFIEVCQALSNAMYIGPVRHALSFVSDAPYFDLQVGITFVKEWKRFKSGRVLKDNESALKVTNEIAHLFGFEKLEIITSEDDRSLKLIVNDRARKLEDLGAGVSNFIVVMANVAMRRPHFIMIDEPENGLHPALQLDFLTRLEAHAKTGLVFATHSYGLARAAAREIFVVTSSPRGSKVRPIGDAPRLSEFLGELSYAAYREIGYEQVLLVEGATEIKTIQEFLRKLHKDHKIVMLPLGGNQLIDGNRVDELAELCRITSNIKVLIDSERRAAAAPIDAKREEFCVQCEKLGIQCHVLERRSTENYLTDAAVKAVFGLKFSGLGPFDALKDAECGWSKNDNWKIAREMEKRDLDGTDLGAFLDAL